MKVKLEYAQLNRRNTIYCNNSDNLPVRQFASPAVQELLLSISDKFNSRVVLDFHPGHVLFVLDYYPINCKGRTFSLNKHVSRFEEILSSDIQEFVSVCDMVVEHFSQMAKYNRL